MAFGQTFETASKGFSHPHAKQTSFGHVIDIINEKEFILRQIYIKQGEKAPTYFERAKGGAVYVEKGNVSFESDETNAGLFEIAKGRVLLVPPFSGSTLHANEESLVYLFTGPESIEGLSEPRVIDTFNALRGKYWGNIESMVGNVGSINCGYAGKKMWMKRIDEPNHPHQPGLAGSFEYHMHKKEAYFIQEGKIRVWLGYGKGGVKPLELNPGDVLVLERGVRHTREALVDGSVIIEISTPDDDADSNITLAGPALYKEISG